MHHYGYCCDHLLIIFVQIDRFNYKITILYEYNGKRSRNLGRKPEQKINDIDHALEYFQKSKKSSYCGIVLYMKGDFKNAFKHLSSYIKSFPGDVGNFIQYGTS